MNVCCCCCCCARSAFKLTYGANVWTFISHLDYQWRQLLAHVEAFLYSLHMLRRGRSQRLAESVATHLAQASVRYHIPL